MRVLYSFIIFLYRAFIRLGSIFNKKANKWISGRKNIFHQLEKSGVSDCKIAWFHASSLGEFEQGRPVMEAFRKQSPLHKILLTFFSPSGYEVRKNYENADFIFYLPLDTPKNVKRFLDIVNPSVVFFIKYEFWYNYLHALHERQIPTYIFSSIFRRNQVFFKWYGTWFFKHLETFECIFVQNDESLSLLENRGLNNVLLAGDTRFDRVVEIASYTERFSLIESFKQSSPLILVGSSWPQEEQLLKKYIIETKVASRIIIAPHDVSDSHIKSIKELFGDDCLLYSEISEYNIRKARVLVIDCIGILSKLYQYADVAVIGGGFGKGIHNILEALTFGVPVFFGPNYNKFQEAKDIISRGGGKVIRNGNNLNRELDLLLTDTLRLSITRKICEQYIQEKKGATNIILSNLKDKYVF